MARTLSETVKLEVPGEPIAQPRARHGRTKDGKHVTYQAPKGHPVLAYKKAIGMMAGVLVAGHSPIDGPVRLWVRFCMPIPASYKEEDLDFQPHIKRPDVDNLVKSVMDALRGIVWVDDSQVCETSLEKWYSTRPRVEIEVTPL